MTTPSASLRALLANAIDYAGLFPPANLPLEQALGNHARYVRTSDASLLGAFVLPVAQFGAAEPFLDFFDEAHPLCVSALGGKPESGTAFRSQLTGTAAAIDRLHRVHGSRVRVEQLEMALPPELDEALFRDAENALAGFSLKAFWEAPVARAEGVIAIIAAHRRTGGSFGFKLRTGGTTVAAFPTTAQVAEILVAAATHDVPMKFTAGLHHPVRQFHASVDTKMHGFLNVLGAGILGREEDWDVPQTATMLADEDPSAFRFDGAGFAWRDWRIGTDDIAAQRVFIASFGSCSFDEPRDDLRALHLL
jgi:hypothetical protein